MKIGITGAQGFIGWHLCCYLKTLPENTIETIKLADKKTFNSYTDILSFVKDLDVIIYLAGVNRATDEELIAGNLEPIKKMINILEDISHTPRIIFSSSTYVVNKPDTAYAQAKRLAAQAFQEWAQRTQSQFVNLIIPNVFGEYGQPFYNSVVATFAHQITTGISPSINNNGDLELIHVQDLAEKIYALSQNEKIGEIRIKGTPSNVSTVAETLQMQYKEYCIKNQLPNLTNHLERCLFNILRGAVPHDQRLQIPKKHQDSRGWLVETVKANSGGQCFVSITKPNITRGNHFHRRKMERFLVLQGKAIIRLRKLFTDEIIEYCLEGDTPSFVDIPTLHTHNITNIGNTDLITLFWADEFFDPKNPDTYYEEV